MATKAVKHSLFNANYSAVYAPGDYLCSNRGMILPLIDESDWSTWFRALWNLIGLLYSFVGIAIAADLFMCAIERITSQTRKVPLVHGMYYH